MGQIKIPSGIKGLIFDCDGTLVDSMSMHMKAWEASFNKFSFYYNEEFLYSLKGMKEEEIIQLYNEKFKTEIDPISIVKKKHELLMKYISDVKPIEPVVEIAKENYGKLPLAVVSGSIGDIVETELSVIGILNLFDFILTADDPYKPKPDPEIFMIAAQKLNLKPEQCLVFEDGDSGIQAASKAGMKTIDIRMFVPHQ